MEDITKAEKAALYFYIFERCTDWKEIYRIAIGEDRYKALSDGSKKTNTTRWKTSHRIQKALEELERNLKARDEEIRNKAREEDKNSEETAPSKPETKTTQAEAVNFLDPDEFLKFANLKANEIQDEKERRSYLEMIAKLMNYKDKDEEQQEQIKAYLPMICEKCELYKRCSSCSLSSCPVSLQ